LSAQEIALNLNSEFKTTLFYCNQPRAKLLEKPNINLVKVRQRKRYWFTLKHLLKKFDLLFYTRQFGVTRFYFRIRKLFRDHKKIVVVVENPIDVNSPKFPATRFNIENADYVYANSRYVSETVKEHFNIKAPVIYAGVDTTIFKPLVLRRFNKKITVLFVGSFQFRKQPHFLLYGASEFPNVNFHLIGAGPAKEDLLKTKKWLGVENVFFHNRLPFPELVKAMQHADIFLYPSKREGFPKATIEAASCGLPVILFDYYQPETVVNGETGFIVKDGIAMFEKLGALIEDPELRHKMSLNARNYALKFDWRIIAHNWEKEFTKICQF